MVLPAVSEWKIMPEQETQWEMAWETEWVIVSGRET